METLEPTTAFEKPGIDSLKSTELSYHCYLQEKVYPIAGV